MVPVEVPDSVPVVAVGEVTAVVSWIVYEPETFAKCPVPPVIVAKAVTWIMFGMVVGQAMPVAEATI